MVRVVMPRQGQSVESCIIMKWHKKPGDMISPGDLLFSYETDKAAFDEEAKDTGTLLAILHQEGEDVPCLEAVCVIGKPGEDVSAACSMPEPEPVAPSVSAPATSISPRARALAARTGADLSQTAASGPNGRIIARDVQAAIDAGAVTTYAARGVAPPGATGTGLGGRATLQDAHSMPSTAQTPGTKAYAPEAHDEPLPNIRKRIAATMLESLSSLAQLTHNATYDATQLLAIRKRFKECGKAYAMEGVTIGDLIVFAVSRTLIQSEHAHLNAHFLGDTMRFFCDAHIGLAVDTPRGLMAPTLRYASKKSLLEISNETKALAASCRAGTIDPDLLTSASFTVSNLGALEIEHFTPIINPPQTGVLGVNTVHQRVREIDGKIEVYPAMTLSLTYDHRALDGAPASRFLRDLKRNLENIQMLLGGGVYHV
jgi:pyruvate dehydrogenase E2 component (dihydrolipoamide acetyltransferase)